MPKFSLVATFAFAASASACLAGSSAVIGTYSPDRIVTGEVYSGFEPIAWNPITRQVLRSRVGWVSADELTNDANNHRYRAVEAVEAVDAGAAVESPRVQHNHATAAGTPETATAGYDGRAHPALLAIPFAVLAVAAARRQVRKTLLLRRFARR